MSDYTVKPLGPDTWDAFARLAERHNGVFGGCWCTWFHTLHSEKTFTAEGNRALKERLVNEGRAHAALVFDGDEAGAWRQYGTTEELPNVYHRKEYEADLDRLPDYRITCLFVDKNYRRQRMTAVALRGALGLIAQTGGGVVEGYPHDTGGQKVGPLRRHPQALRAGRLQIRPSQGHEELRDAQGDALTRAAIQGHRRLRSGHGPFLGKGPARSGAHCQRVAFPRTDRPAEVPAQCAEPAEA